MYEQHFACQKAAAAVTLMIGFLFLLQGRSIALQHEDALTTVWFYVGGWGMSSISILWYVACRFSEASQ